MNEKFNIFVNNRHVLISSGSDDLARFRAQNKAIILENPNRRELEEMIERFDSTNRPSSGLIFCENPSNFFHRFKALFTPVEACGSMVFNKNGDLLMIFRRGWWDMPKGKIEEGENLKEAALRELLEETGIEPSSVSDTWHDTWHTYHEAGKRMMKTTHWFTMEVNNIPKISPQIEEGIEKGEWVPVYNLGGYLYQSFGSVALLIKQVILGDV